MTNFHTSLAAMLCLASGLVHADEGGSDGAEVLDYTIISSGHEAGRGEDRYGPGGDVASRFSYNDRGRGPDITAHYRWAPDGSLQSADLSGHDYLKAPVDEHFSVRDGVARWHSTSEGGSSDGAGYYVSINGPPSELALLVAASLRAGGTPIRLFPGGEATVQKVAQATVHAGGKDLHVTEYLVTGLSFDPQPVWLDDANRFFGSPGTWFAAMRTGFEAENARLYDIQLRAEGARLSELARTLAHRPRGPVAIEHVRVFDAEHAVARDNQTVLVTGERIARVGDDGTVDVSGATERIDGRGKTLLPGLFDMHAHVSSGDGLLDIASGVTSVRDMGNDLDELRHLQENWNKGSAVGPRIAIAGIVDGHGPYQAPAGIYADTLDEALSAVHRYASAGAVQIKVYSSLNPAFVAPMASEAHKLGLRLSGHVPNGMIASQFVEAGADEIQHINFVMLNFLDNSKIDTRTPARFVTVAEQAAGIDLDSKSVADFIALLKQHHTTLDVTLGAFETMFTGRPGEVAPGFTPILARLPVQVQRQAYSGGLSVAGGKDELYKRSYAAMLAMAGRLYRAGVPILAGTDDTAGFALHRELELEVRIGIPPAKALQIATWNAARLLKQQDEIGSIAPGKRADLYLVEGDPLADISDIRRARLVIKDGIFYRSDALYAALGVKPAP